MRQIRILGAFLATLAVLSTLSCTHAPVLPDGDPNLAFPGEDRLANIRQLTFGGTNAEAYWSFDGRWLTFQHKGQGPRGIASSAPGITECDQIYAMSVDGSVMRSISGGKGRTTCAFYYPNNSRILYSSTAAASPTCPPHPDHSRGYVWPIYDSYQFYSARTDGSDPIPIEPGASKAYHAEATVCHDGSVIFTSDRDGDLDLYTAKLDRLGTMTDVKRITTSLGYDGGAFFSPDCKQIVWRTSRPRPGAEENEYRALLAQRLVKPGELEIWVANADGSNARQVTRIAAATFAPNFTPDGKRILFASNPRDPRGRMFDIYMIDVNGTRMERITHSNTFDSFPMFSPDGRYLAFSSNRNATAPRETNVFVADWIEKPSQPLSVNDTDPANRFLALVEQLSTPDMDGRGLGTEGLARAEDLIAERFTSIGLKPLFETYRKKSNASGPMRAFRHQVEVKINKAGDIRVGHNVVGTLGNGCARGERPIVVGAHLDALGFGAENSLEPTKSGIHVGADDNASGVAAMLETARIVSATPAARNRCFIFAAFTGEEHGIAGSSRLAELFKQWKLKPKAMLNMDMVGRMENNRLVVFGTDSAKEWKTLVEKECATRRLTCPGGGDGYGPSDHMAFYIAGAPVLHFFTGPHVDYHRVSDTANKINATGGVQAAEVIAAVALRSSAPGQRFKLQQASPTPSTARLLGHNESRRGKGGYLGTIPDYSTLTSPHGPSGRSAAGGGVKLAGTRPGSPADLAGVRAGDVLFGILLEGEEGNDNSIATLEDFMGLLAKLKPGDKITLAVKRDSTVLKLPATVGKHQ